MQYTFSPFAYRRFETREVKVGDLGIGGKNPIRVQSMTTSDTRDTESTVRQILDLERAGCELVRLTVPSMADAENLPNIRRRLKEENSKVPLAADIHFTPSAAMLAAEYMEKVRINPGNFVDRKKFAVREYTDSEYNEELERISEVFLPFVKKCKELGRAVRIGTNHGSLSDRIMNRFGDTPLGMVESALEFIRIAETVNFHDIIVSMKASNPQVMVHAYRLLVSRFIELGMKYPVHLGVTEAGDGKDGRIKSAMGIGTLLEDGIGDTIRVSLTEDAVHEIPVAKILVKKFNSGTPFSEEKPEYSEFRNPYTYTRRKTEPVPVGDLRIGENYPVRAETSFPSFSEKEILDFLKLFDEEKLYVKPEILHFHISTSDELKNLADSVRSGKIRVPVSASLSKIQNNDFININEHLLFLQKISVPAEKLSELSPESVQILKKLTEKNTIEVSFSGTEDFQKNWKRIRSIFHENIMISLNEEAEDRLYTCRKILSLLGDEKVPFLVSGKYGDAEDAMYGASVLFGSLLLDGSGDCIRLAMNDQKESLILSFDILQAARQRTVKTEFISCPSCGRTLFDLQKTTARIKERTGHLVGVKIAVMGCIVNGPGEMADADFGYVGAGPGKVHLYLGKEIVMKSISSEEADEKLVELIKSQGKWSEP